MTMKIIFRVTRYLCFYAPHTQINRNDESLSKHTLARLRRQRARRLSLPWHPENAVPRFERSRFKSFQEPSANRERTVFSEDKRARLADSYWNCFFSNNVAQDCV